MAESPLDRRAFIRKSAVAGAALTLSASSYGRVNGANARLSVAFLGAGGRAQAHINLLNRLRTEGIGIAGVAVCDVWDGLEEDYDHEFPPGRVVRRKYSQGLYPSAKKLGLEPGDSTHVVKDYRRLLELKEVDAVCITTPDHWHARMAIDAAEAGKHLYCEKPMTRTAEEAQAVLDALARSGVIATVGVQSMADPDWSTANDWIRAGKIGHVAQGQTGIFRNDVRGQWRFYRLCEEMNPKTIDWDLFLGASIKGIAGKPLAPPTAFDRERFAHWRCHADYSCGPFTDFLIHPITRMLAAMGLDLPTRVVASGGTYLERDGRDVPDVATIIADFAERGCQLTATCTSISSYPVEEVIRGRLGTIRFTNRGVDLFTDNPLGGSGLPQRIGDRDVKAKESVVIERPKDNTAALWQNFLDCVRTNNRKTMSPPDLAAAAIAVASMGWESYRSGKAQYWDAEKRMVTTREPAANARSKDVSHTDLQAPDYMKLAGPWTNGKDPANG